MMLSVPNGMQEAAEAQALAAQQRANAVEAEALRRLEVRHFRDSPDFRHSAVEMCCCGGAAKALHKMKGFRG